MKLTLVCRLMSAAVVIASMGAALSGSAFAHGGRQVGKFEFNVGFVNEPALEGLVNGVDLRVENAETEEPLPGLDQSVQVKVTHVSSGDSKILDLEPVKGEPGHYTAAFIPTAPGEYRFQFTGAIDGMQLDETFASGADEFSMVESSKALQIPEQQLEMREIGAAIRGAMTAAAQAQDSAATANMFAVVGLVAGVLGLGFGAGSLVIARKQQQTGAAAGKRTALRG